MRLAKEFGGEVVSCDSIAVFRLMDIGSAKPSVTEREQVMHHCLDLYWPNEFCTAGDYARHARAAISDVSSRGKLPIVAGGTGLYLRALLEGLAPAPPRDEALRVRLRKSEEKRGPGHLHRLLKRFDRSAANAVHPNDVPKLIRSLEVTLAGRTPQTEQWRAGRDALRGYRVLQFALSPNRDELYARINKRAAGMFALGLVEETVAICERFGEGCRSLGALGYAQAVSFLRDDITRGEAIASAQQGHRNYAKRQLTWFRREPAMHWLQGFGDQAGTQAEALRVSAAHVHAEGAIQ